MADNKPIAEIDLDEALVRALLAAQHPDLAALPLVRVASGWDNVLFRLGDDLVVRLPRRQVAAPLVEHEQHWLPRLAPTLPLPVPAPLRVGRAALGYPWSWSISAWLPGVIAARMPIEDPLEAATSLGGFLRALHQPAPPDVPANLYRGIPLADRSPDTLARIERLAGVIDVPTVRDRWAEVVAIPRWSAPPVWLHGDLHPANVLVENGRISAVIDFGDITSGDPATDLAIAWMMLPPPARPTLRAAAGDVDDHTWTRARGWALSLALAYLAHSADDPVIAEIGRHTLDAVLADEG